MSRTALILETNPVITERYLDYTHASDWHIMLKDTLNGFLEKLQQEQFSLIVAEESILPQAIIQMLKSIGVPFVLSSNNQNPETTTLPRNFNRTELLTVFDRLVPYVPEEKEDESSLKNTTVNEIFADLEDDEETFELTSDAVITEADEPSHEPWENNKSEPEPDLFENNDSLFEDDIKAPETLSDAAPAAEETVENTETDGLQDDAVKAAVTEWLNKNARGIIKEIVLEQLTSLSGKNND